MPEFKQDPERVRHALSEHWRLPEPLGLGETLRRGVSADIWEVHDGQGRRWVAKLAYEDQRVYETGLRAAELAEGAGVVAAAPRRSATGELTVMLPTVPGMEHPLALMPFVEGEELQAGDLPPEDAGQLLARVQRAVAATPIDRVDTIVQYVTDDSYEIAYGELLWPRLKETAAAVAGLDLAMGVCYGDDPELIRTHDGALCIVDWGAVCWAPLWWDVACWALQIDDDEQRSGFVRTWRKAMGPLAAGPPDVYERFVALRIAQLARFRAYRVHRSDHYSVTADDIDALRQMAGVLGVSLPK